MSGESTGVDVEALAKAIWTASRADESTISATGANIVARAVLASDWLAAHDAATADRVRRETAEGIAQAIDEMKSFAHGKNPISEAHLIGYGTARRVAARIAREQAR